MDTSEVYIKMCEKAEEIQNIALEKSKHGWLRTSAVKLLINAIDKKGEVFVFADTVWLPRQDQLQEIMYPSESARKVFSEFVFRVGDPRLAFLDPVPEYKPFFSMEQLWLAFVMREKHGKYWDGEDWVKE